MQNTLFTFAGFIPYVGPAVTVSYWVYSLYKADVASQIRNYTDYGKSVRVNIATSNYGTFYGVFSWDGTTCPMVETESQPNGGTETLKSVQVK